MMPSRLPRPAEPPPAELPSPAEPSASARSIELAVLIRAEIESVPDRRITFARFMERALYEPRLGYYRQPADRPTDAGDFLTAPETHPIFGWTLGRRIEAIWAGLGEPAPFKLVEYGAGSGTLALSILDGLQRRGSTALLEALRYEPIESNPNRLADLVRRFGEAGLADRLTEPAPVPAPVPTAAPAPASTAVPAPAGVPAAVPAPVPAPTAAPPAVPATGVVLANEFLDALPVDRVVRQDGRLRELFVVWHDRFAESAAEPSTPALAERLADDGVELAEGQVAEVCLGLDSWLDDVAARIADGYVIAIDYGYPAAELYGPRRLAGTLLGYRGHRVQEDPFADVGLTDLTAHVDFTAVARLAERRGFRSLGLATQTDFLTAAGLEAELRDLQASPETAAQDYLRARSGIVRMMDPRQMGRFRVLTLGRGAVPCTEPVRGASTGRVR